MEGWKCPSCGSCYSPRIEECSNCNTKSRTLKVQGASATFIPHKQCNCKKDESCTKCVNEEKLELLCD